MAEALIRLVDDRGDDRAVSLADSVGRYRIEAPRPGEYRLVAERIGYDAFETPLLEASAADGRYAIDLLMRRSPVPIRGIEVSVEQAERQIRLMVGMSPRSLRVAPLHREQILDYAERGYDLEDVMRWQSVPGLVVRRTDEGWPCFQVRGRGCLPVYLNSFRLTSDFIDATPVDLASSIVILMPKESILYPGGAVLLYTEAWIR